MPIIRLPQKVHLHLCGPTSPSNSLTSHRPASLPAPCHSRSAEHPIGQRDPPRRIKGPEAGKGQDRVLGRRRGGAGRLGAGTRGVRWLVGGRAPTKTKRGHRCEVREVLEVARTLHLVRAKLKEVLVASAGSLRAVQVGEGLENDRCRDEV